MFLISLYSEPSGLFNRIEFKEGVNFIFGKKEKSTDSKDSLNGIGKSTSLELIDFCLLSDFNKSSRLKKERARLEGYNIVLEFRFENDENIYVIKRSVDNLKELEFGTKNNTAIYSNQNVKTKLFDLIFENKDYVGVLKESWYRSLLAFFMKIHKKQRSGGQFSDPIKYLVDGNSYPELNQYHFYFLGLDNTLVVENFNLQEGVKDRATAIRAVKRLIETKYHTDIKDVNSKLSKLRNDIKKAKEVISLFKLASHHKDIETQLNELTFKIKELSEYNFYDQKKIKLYSDSYLIKDTLNKNRIRSIEKLYSEIDKELSKLVKKTLTEAIAFREKLSESRESFLKSEIQKLENDVSKRDLIISELDLKRSELFSFLKSKKAFNDLTEAFAYQVKIEAEYSELESNVKTYNDLEAEKQSWTAQNAEMSLLLAQLLENEKERISEFEDIFNFVYDKIYPKSASSGFTISPNYQSNSKISINVSFDHEESKGWNYGRTLIYDLSVMINLINKKIKSPRFLIHDGIFDGMDKAHFVETYHFVNSMQNQGKKFQYIITVNEEGTLEGNFGNIDELLPEKISKQAVLTLTRKNEFWKK